MKQSFALLFILLAWVCLRPALAQDAAPPTASVYNVNDVAVDVTSDSSAKARDQAIAEAQHAALNQLLTRLGTDPSVAAKLSNDDIATLVQNFEVRDEHTSAVRYIGTFDVQFRPMAMRNFLGSHQAHFNDTPAAPILIIPVVKDGDHMALWEEPTRWAKLWAEAARDGGMMPLVVPSGSEEDKTTLSAFDAVNGKVDAIKNMIDAYKTNGAVVVVLAGALENPVAGFTVDLQHFGTKYDDGSDIEHMTLAGTPSKDRVDSILAQGIKQARQKIEKEWKQDDKSTALQSAGGTNSIPAATVEEPDNKLPVSVQFATLGQWSDLQRRLLATPGIQRVDIMSVGRGETEIELGFSGRLEDLQVALARRNMRLTQDVLSGQWMLKGF